MEKILSNLIRISSSNPTMGTKMLEGLLVQGLIKDYIEKSGIVDVSAKFKPVKHYYYNVEYEEYVYLLRKYYRRKLKRGKEDRPQGLLRSRMKWKKQKVSVSKWDVDRLKLSKNDEIINISPDTNYSLHMLELKNFKLVYRTYKQTDFKEQFTHCHVRIKYTKTIAKNEMFQKIFSSTQCYPNKGSYVNLIKFDTYEDPKPILIYLYHIFNSLL